MSSANKKKGTAWESAVRNYANDRHLQSHRPAQMGAGDVGDVHTAGLLCIQAKDTASHRFGEWLADVEEQRERAGLPFGVVVAKRRRASVGDAYAVSTLDTLLALVRRLDVAENLLKYSTAGGSYQRWLDSEDEER